MLVRVARRFHELISSRRLKKLNIATSPRLGRDLREVHEMGLIERNQKRARIGLVLVRTSRFWRMAGLNTIEIGSLRLRCCPFSGT